MASAGAGLCSERGLEPAASEDRWRRGTTLSFSGFRFSLWVLMFRRGNVNFHASVRFWWPPYSVLGTVGLDFWLPQLRDEILTFGSHCKSGLLVVVRCEGLGTHRCIIYHQRGLGQSQQMCVQGGEVKAKGA